MIKKILKYVLMIAIMIVVLMLLLVFRPEKKAKQETQQNQTIENEVVEVMSIDETDKNVIGYVTIEKIGLEKAPIADGTDNKTISKYVGHFKDTSYLEGNVCLCSHNRGSKKTTKIL